MIQNTTQLKSSILKVTFQVALLWTMIWTITRAIRLPNDFSEAHWLLDYRFGFMKRALVGSICNIGSGILEIQMNPNIIAILSSITISALAIGLVIVTKNILNNHSFSGSSLMVLLVFASSPFIVMTGHLFGYFDCLLYAYAIIALLLIFKKQIWWAGLVQAIAVLTHESYILIGFPATILASYLLMQDQLIQNEKSKYLISLSFPVIVFLSLVLFQSLFLDASLIRQQLVEHLTSFGFVSTRVNHVAGFQTTGFFEFFRQQSGLFGARILSSRILLSVGPSLMVLICFLHSSYRIRPFTRISLLIMTVVLAPLVMHTTAWDTARIWTYALGGSILALWVLCKIKKHPIDIQYISLLAVPALLINVFTRIPLMDSEIERFTDTTRLIIYLPAFLITLLIILKSRKADNSTTAASDPNL